MQTERLYFADPYLAQFSARVVARAERAGDHEFQAAHDERFAEPGHRDRYQGIRSLIRWMYQKNSVNSGLSAKTQ